MPSWKKLVTSGSSPSFADISAASLTLDTQLAVAQGGTGVTSKTGTGNVVLSSSPTIVTPTIASMTNATHTHANSAGGGQITLGTGTTGNYVATAVAGDGIDVSGATGNVTITAETSTAGNLGAVIVAGGTNCTVGYSGGTATVTVSDAFLKNDANDTTTGTVTAGGFTTTGILSAKTNTFTKTSDTVGDYKGDVVYFGGTEDMIIGTIYHYKSDGTWEATNANTAATCDGLLAVALGSVSDDNYGMLLRGMVTLDHDPGQIGDVLFLSTAANGDATTDIPADDGNIIRIIGYCLDSSDGQIWFDPDKTFIEVSA